MFIAAIGILSVIAQTGMLAMLMKTLGSKHTIMVGLLFEMLQLMWYGFGSQTWMMWAAGILASISRYVVDLKLFALRYHLRLRSLSIT